MSSFFGGANTIATRSYYILILYVETIVDNPLFTTFSHLCCIRVSKKIQTWANMLLMEIT